MWLPARSCGNGSVTIPRSGTKFRSRYFDELKASPAAWQPIIEAARHATVTLIYSSHDTEHNNAVALQEFLQRHMHKKTPAHKRAA